MNHIKLSGTPVENQYRGAGLAYLVVEKGVPSKLIYENNKNPGIAIDLSDDEFYELLADKGVDFYDLERKKSQILMGTCSCYDFCFPEVLIDFNEEV
jgi:hypothetical protein